MTFETCMSEYSVKNNQTNKFMRQVHFNFKRYSLYCFKIELFAVLSYLQTSCKYIELQYKDSEESG